MCTAIESYPVPEFYVEIHEKHIAMTIRNHVWLLDFDVILTVIKSAYKFVS